MTGNNIPFGLVRTVNISNLSTAIVSCIERKFYGIIYRISISIILSLELFH